MPHQVVVPEKRLIVSEKAVLLEDLAAVVAPGDVVEGVVGTIMDWGAFVECRSGGARVGCVLYTGGVQAGRLLLVVWNRRTGGPLLCLCSFAAYSCLICRLTTNPLALPPIPSTTPIARAVNGQPCPRAEAVLPLRELSYAWVASPAEVLRSGQPVRVSVLFVQTDPAAKVGAGAGFAAAGALRLGGGGRLGGAAGWPRAGGGT